MKHQQLSLREAREASGLTAREIAMALGMARSQLYRIESGECQASFDLARRLREYWPKTKVPDLAIYDPPEFLRRRDDRSAAA